MKYCSNCGHGMNDSDIFCSKCGLEVGGQENTELIRTAAHNTHSDGLSIAIKIFMVIGCIAVGWSLIPLLWCIPLTVHVFRRLNTGTYIGTGCKICVLLFVNLIAGICLLCREEYY